MADKITNSEDVIDSREVIERISELRASWAEATGDNPDDYANMSEDDWQAGLNEDEAKELSALIAFADKASTVTDWPYGEQFIRDSYFVEYAKELADNIGAVPENAAWPLRYIDWEAAADALQGDYTDFDFDGVTYWARA